MLKRQTSGSVVCPTCGRLAGVQDERCFECGRWNPGLWGYSQSLGRFGRDLGFAEIILWGCGALFVVSLLLGMRSFLSPSQESLFRLGASGAIPIFGAGRWWTVLSAAWLHGGIFHILMNMWVMRGLAPLVARFYGAGRLVIIYTVSSAAGFGLTSVVGYLTLTGRLALPGPVQGAPITVGASAPLFGLFGALMVFGRRTGSQSLTQNITFNLIFLAAFGIFVPFVDNLAHLGGFLGGYVTSRWLDPMREETQQHWLGALACLALMALSIILSVLVPLP